MTKLIDLHPIIPTLVAFGIDFVITIGVALFVVVFPAPKDSWRCWIYAFSAGTLIATGTIGMLTEALDRSEEVGVWSESVPWVPVVLGMICGICALQATVTLVIWIQRKETVTTGSYTMVTEDGASDDSPRFSLTAERQLQAHTRTTIPMPIPMPIEDVIHRRAHPVTPAEALGEAAAAIPMQQQHQVRQSMMIVCSLILQQLPEGIMLGAAFANVAAIDPNDAEGSAARSRAFRTALGIAVGSWITTIGEAIAIVVPLKRERMPALNIISFVVASGFMEGIGAVLACVLLTHVTALLPFILAGVAGSMIFSVLTEMVPAALEHEPRVISNVLMMTGFIAMIVFIHMFG